ncbi:hypothetical protein J2S43_001451 [Catenuloplanes nepalensis]|uniref:Uncharacterized protein n=1 Tax=Catenuloplanes nepalensis TaxID=587533 RepID=A0ABT9MNG6_9ACTN|nr:hypothetical protein [Catenuloplanes nepalensis]MDP9792939.1 hypothetical protein [Catenuloplanes nepalensis]
MSDADEVVYDELPEAIRIVHAALLVPERVAEAVPLALQLLAHGWITLDSRSEVARGWNRLGMESNLMVSMLFPDALHYRVLVTPATDDPVTLEAARQMALAAADGLDLLGEDPSLSVDRRWELVTAAADLRSMARRPG